MYKPSQSELLEQSHSPSCGDVNGSLPFPCVTVSITSQSSVSITVSDPGVPTGGAEQITREDYKLRNNIMLGLMKCFPLNVLNVSVPHTFADFTCHDGKK